MGGENYPRIITLSLAHRAGPLGEAPGTHLAVRLIVLPVAMVSPVAGRPPPSIDHDGGRRVHDWWRIDHRRGWRIHDGWWVVSDGRRGRHNGNLEAAQEQAP